jgi:5-methylcytosine-specific restriction endonuclease McrA
MNKYLCIEGCGASVSGKGRRCWKCANSGKNNPAWQGGKAKEKYKGFTREIKQRIRYRDNFECQICHKKQTPFIKESEKLQVHHINYNKSHTIDTNLISLCKECHIKTNFNRQTWIEFFKNLLNKEK